MGVETEQVGRTGSRFIRAEAVAAAFALLKGCVDQWESDDAPIKDMAIQEIKTAINRARVDLGLEEGR